MKETILFTFFILAMLLTACSGDGSTPKAEPTEAPQRTQPAEPPTVEAVTVPADTNEPAPTGERLDPGSEVEPEGNTTAVLVDILSNLSYSGLFPDQQITLIDGYAYYDEGDGGNPFVRLIDRLIVTGDLNEDGTEDAVALLADYATGSGDFVFLTVVLDVWNEPTPTEALMVGDRIPVKSLTIDGSQVIVELIGPGPGDAACCPTWNVRKVFEFVDGKLVERSSEELSKASLNNLSGTSWRLVDLNTGQEPVLPETEITLKFENGQINGSAGCNTYNSAVSGDENMPQVFTVSPITTTRLVCPDPIANQETAYLDHFSKVTRWRYDFGYLALSYTLGEVIPGELLFAPQTP